MNLNVEPLLNLAATSAPKYLEKPLTLCNGQLKVHKTDIPARPVVSYNIAPAYKIVKYGNKVILFFNNFKPKYGLINSLNLIDLVNDVRIINNANLASFDVVSLLYQQRKNNY